MELKIGIFGQKMRFVILWYFAFYFSVAGQSDTIGAYTKYSELIPGKTYTYRTIYGNTYNQKLKHIYAKHLTFYVSDSEADTIRINKQEIVFIHPEHVSARKIRIRNKRPYYTPKYFFNENALELDSAEGVGIHNRYLFFNTICLKIHRNWELNSNFILYAPVSVGTRYMKNIFDNHHIGFNLNVWFLGEIDTFRIRKNIIFPAIINGGVRYTIGNTNSNFTLGILTHLFHRDFLNRISRGRYYSVLFTPALGLYACFQERFHNRWAILGEVHQYIYSFGYGAGGISYIFKKNYSLLLGACMFYNSSFRISSSFRVNPLPYLILPYISFNYYTFHRT